MDQMAQLSLSAPKKEEKARGTAAKSTQGNKKKKLKDKYPEWRFKQNGSQDKTTHDGKTSWWCETLNMWALHEPKDCNASKNTTSKPKGVEPPPSALNIARALIAISFTNGEQDEEEDKE
jgi:hypothetical protein